MLGHHLIKSLKDTVNPKRKKSFKEKLLSLYYSSFNWIYAIVYRIRAFKNNVLRVIDYLPIVWNHRNWDHGYVFQFQKKLYEDLYKGCFVEGHHVYNKTKQRRLKAFIGVLDRLSKDEYCMWKYDYLENKYGAFPNDLTDFRRSKIRENPSLQEAYRKDSEWLCKLEQYQRKQDLDLLHKYLLKYSEGWWD